MKTLKRNGVCAPNSYNIKLAILFFSFILFLSCNDINDFFRKAPNVEYINTIHDFGVISLKDTIEHTFKIKNISNVDLFISDVQSSCNCRISDFTKDAITLNEIANIKVQFIPMEKSFIDKTIVIKANTKPQFTILKLKGRVE